MLIPKSVNERWLEAKGIFFFLAKLDKLSLSTEIWLEMVDFWIQIPETNQ